MTNFENCLNKGDYGELIVDELLQERNYIVYKPINEGSHPIDRLCIKDQKIVMIDVKCKPKRDSYNDSGFDLADYEKYLLIDEQIPVWIFFVDEKLGTIYYQSIEILRINREVEDENRIIRYPFIQPAKNHKTGVTREVIYFPMESFKHLAELTDEHLNALRGLPDE